jgi:hypothetical protein
VKVLLHAYPWVTLTAIVLTANHYILDAVAGILVFLAGYAGSRLFTRAGRRPRAARDVDDVDLATL